MGVFYPYELFIVTGAIIDNWCEADSTLKENSTMVIQPNFDKMVSFEKLF
jgi:hypothetical protein